MNIITGNKIGTRVNLFVNGTLHSKECGTEEVANQFFKTILETKGNPTDDNIANVLEFLNKNIRIAKAGGFEFDMDSNQIFLKGFNTPVPEDIMETVEAYVENGYPIESITNFWKLLMGNPDKRIRQDLFKFINTHDFSLTDKGYMVVYKTVDYMNKVNQDLAEFVSETFVRVKDKWKESPKNYVVYKELSTETVDVDNGYYELEGCLDEEDYYEEYGEEPEWIEDVEDETRVTSELKHTKQKTYDKWLLEGKKDMEYVGNLESLMEGIAEMKEEETSTFTDKHSGTMKIKLGVPVKMDRTECNGDPREECSYGLHVGATKYVENFRSGGESPVLVCLVNPMHVVAVPMYDNSKMRVSEYYPFAKGSVDNNNKIEIIESPYFENDYIVHEQKELEKLLKEENDETLRPTAKNASEDTRDVDEYYKILECRVIDLG